MAAIYMMKHYEFTYLTRQDMPEDEAKKLQDKLVALIAAKNGTITDLPKAYKKDWLTASKNRMRPM
jgi:Ribosomal protein S6.